jgi:hypothetical protein
MKRSTLNLGGAAIVMIASIASTAATASASAGLCGEEIAKLRQSLPRGEDGALAFVGSGTQTIDAQLGHQPTVESVERAKKLARARILAMLAQAEALDLKGDQRGCGETIATMKLLLAP